MHDLVADPRLQRVTAEEALPPSDTRSTKDQLQAIGKKCTATPRRAAPVTARRRMELAHGEILSGDAAVAQHEAVLLMGGDEDGLDARMRAKALKRHDAKHKADDAADSKLETLRQARRSPLRRSIVTCAQEAKRLKQEIVSARHVVEPAPAVAAPKSAAELFLEEQRSKYQPRVKMTKESRFERCVPHPR